MDILGPFLLFPIQFKFLIVVVDWGWILSKNHNCQYSKVLQKEYTILVHNSIIYDHRQWNQVHNFFFVKALSWLGSQASLQVSGAPSNYRWSDCCQHGPTKRSAKKTWRFKENLGRRTITYPINMSDQNRLYNRETHFQANIWQWSRYLCRSWTTF